MTSASNNPASHPRQQWTKAYSPAERTLSTMLLRQAKRIPKKTLVSAGDVALTYAQACEAAGASAAGLQSGGIRAGDRVALICTNRMEFIEMLLGCAWLGAVLVPINVASRGPQLQHILSNSGARLLVVEGACAENLAMLDPSTLSVEAIWSIDAATTIRMGNLESVPIPRRDANL
jgi:crotonobetaine/carnitine-CoA ligase